MVPKLIFIVPYKNRIEHKYFFSQYLSHVLQGQNYEIYFSHQIDDRPFNRGATKNIGFLTMKQKYLEDYKNITFVFHDIDIVPYQNIFDYQTSKGIIKHFYGFDYALGGIVSILGEDFEKVNGYPNYWGWGMEDTILQHRCNNHNLTIDRTHFYAIGSPQILQLFDGVSRLINNKETKKYSYDNGTDGLLTITNLKYTVDKHEFDFNKKNIFMINISFFQIPVLPEQGSFYHYDLRENPKQIMKPNEENKLNKPKEWTDIPSVNMPNKFVLPSHFKTKVISKNPPKPTITIRKIHRRIQLGGIM
jgi:N-terminal region of glycosyl transferase group 7/N-terminal domain of galactosyltransferase